MLKKSYCISTPMSPKIVSDLTSEHSPSIKTKRNSRADLLLLFDASYLTKILKCFQELCFEIILKISTLRFVPKLWWTSPENHSVATFSLDSSENVHHVVLRFHLLINDLTFKSRVFLTFFMKPIVSVYWYLINASFEMSALPVNFAIRFVSLIFPCTNFVNAALVWFCVM